MRTMNEAYCERLITYINEYKQTYGNSPSVDEIGEGVGIPRSTVARYLRYMSDRGMLSYGGRRKIETHRQAHLAELISIPVCGDISCGTAKLAEEDIEGYISLPKSMVGSGTFFVLRADGDSMVNAGIDHGDLVVIRQQTDAQQGQIIVPLIDGEFSTLKRYYPHFSEHTVDLVPENEAYPVRTIDLTEQDFCIQGIAIKVLKDLN